MIIEREKIDIQLLYEREAERGKREKQREGRERGKEREGKEGRGGDLYYYM